MATPRGYILAKVSSHKYCEIHGKTPELTSVSNRRRQGRGWVGSEVVAMTATIPGNEKRGWRRWRLRSLLVSRYRYSRIAPQYREMVPDTVEITVQSACRGLCTFSFGPHCADLGCILCAYVVSDVVNELGDREMFSSDVRDVPSSKI